MTPLRYARRSARDVTARSHAVAETSAITPIRDGAMHE